MSVLLLALGLGIITGLRTMTALTTVSWAAWLGRLDLGGTRLGFLGYAWTPWLFSLMALAELVADKLPSTPSRKEPPGFAARIVAGGFAGAVIGTPSDMTAAGLIAGVVGAVIGTLGGAAVRAKLAHAFGRDLPAALLEDVAAYGSGLLAVLAL